MGFEQKLQVFREELNYVLSCFLDPLGRSAENIGPPAGVAWRTIRDFTLQGGKRLRPFLVCTAYKGYGGRNGPEILKAACAMELMQTFLLIHDDIIDRASLRRGYPTVNRTFEKEYQSAPVDLPHFSMSLAILAGDVAAAYGALAISQSQFPPGRISRALDLYAKIMADESYGQVLDMHTLTGKKLTERDVLNIFYYKTTRYTIEGPLHLGAILAGAPGPELRSLSSFARPLGAAFQLRDDILGLFGTEESIGKAIGSDLKEGKPSLFIIRALGLAPGADRQVIRECLGKQDATDEQVRRVRNIVESCGALEYASNLIVSWVNEAKAALESCSLLPDSHDTLSGFADYLAERGS